MPKGATDLSQGAQMIRARCVGGQQHENQVAGATINRIKVYALMQADKCTDWGAEAGNARMRDGHAFANARGSKVFTFNDGVENIAAINTVFVADCFRKDTEDLLARLAGWWTKDDALPKEARKSVCDLL